MHSKNGRINPWRNETTRIKKVKLGLSDLEVAPVGLGTMQWGNYRPINNQESFHIDSICDLYQTSIAMGVDLFDTAEIYGFGQSERLLGICNENRPENSILATKFMPFPWRLSRKSLFTALQNSLKRLGVPKVDLYQVHWPAPPIRIDSWMEAMVEAMEKGLISAVGVSNYSVQQTQQAHDRLALYGIPLATNQVKYSLLERKPEYSGLLKLCKDLNVTIIAYSPLGRGLLSGKFTRDNIPPDFQAWRYNKEYLSRIEPLIFELNNIGKQYHDKTASQVALNWLISKGVVAIPGAKNITHAVENAGALGWSLTEDEMNRLDEFSDKVIYRKSS
jgi:aryl-alcohol dehydrogenase-like predicted oxidoreductase